MQKNSLARPIVPCMFPSKAAATKLSFMSPEFPSGVM
jgi:hypothetical protein